MRMKKFPRNASPSSPPQWLELSTVQRRKAVLEYFRTHLSGTTVCNLHTGLAVRFTMNLGGRKLANGGALYLAKAQAVHITRELVRVGRYNNFGAPKPTDNPTTRGFLNLVAVGIIGSQVYRFRINLLVRADGIFYYNHEVIKKTLGTKK